MKQFRSDIEGLRSLAILPILLFHAGIDMLRGGYTGVDVFFVISGFLITMILREDISEGRFSILVFYQRRVARILPALIFVLAFVALAAGPVLLLPVDIVETFHSIAAAAGFISNIYFWFTTNYFSSAAESLPLLHTWSLGVEEQFYILFPLLMFLISKFSDRALRITFIAMGLVSLALGIVVQQDHPTADFYLLPFRAWELLLGAYLAIGGAPRLRPSLAGLAALGGIGLILASAFLLAAWLPFPSPFALAPCIGTALVIAYGQQGLAGRILSLAPLRWIGRISYSLYLWHWPIITFYRQRTGNELDGIEPLALIAASIAAAALTYHWVELPVQRALRRVSPARAVAIGAGAVTAVVVGALLVAANARAIWPLDPGVERIASYKRYADWPRPPERTAARRCFIENQSEQLDPGTCLTPVSGKRNILLFGDSHANMYGGALRTRYPEFNWLQATHFGCPPIVRGWSNPSCSGMVARVLDTVAPSGGIQGVVLASRWRADQADRLEETIRRLRGMGLAVTVIGPVPEYEGNFPSQLARAMHRGDPAAVAAFESHGVRATDRAIRAAALRAGARYYSAVDSICPQGRCTLLSPDGGPMHFDYGHLTHDAAIYALRDLPAP